MEHSGVTIRTAVPLDCTNIARLIKASWENSQAAQAVQVSDQRTMEQLVSLLSDSFVIAADVSGRLIGAMACTLVREPWGRPDDWFLNDEFMVISSSWVTRGIAERLLTQAEEFADRELLPLVLGTSLMTSVPYDSLLDRRPGYQRLSAQFLRMPRVTVGNEVESATGVAAH